ncbi:MAG: hypothetical protein P8186_07450 [Anaerolineae bacterium]|jgi:hypothetical protein
MDKRLSSFGSEEQLLLTLTQRLLSSPYAGGSAEEIQILVGKLPPALPIELSLPEKARVIGSLVRGDHDVQIVLDVDQPADAVVAFYRAQLEPAGWQEFDWPVRPGGFGYGWVMFCQSRRGPSLTVSAFEAEGAWTDIRLNLQTDRRQSPCAVPDRAYGRMMSPIPNLRAPAGARMYWGGSSGGGGGNSWHSTATLETGLEAAALAAEYNQQLQAAGWETVDQERAGSSAWSTWRFRDDEGDTWAGTLLILDAPGKADRRVAYLYVELLS